MLNKKLDSITVLPDHELLIQKYCTVCSVFDRCKSIKCVMQSRAVHTVSSSVFSSVLSLGLKVKLNGSEKSFLWLKCICMKQDVRAGFKIGRDWILNCKFLMI